MLYYILKWINFELRNICDLFEYVKKISIVSLHIFFLVYWPKNKFCLIKLQYFTPNLISLNILSNLLSNNLIQGGITGEDIESKEQYINFSSLLHKTKLFDQDLSQMAANVSTRVLLCHVNIYHKVRKCSRNVQLSKIL